MDRRLDELANPDQPFLVFSRLKDSDKDCRDQAVIEKADVFLIGGDGVHLLQSAWNSSGTSRAEADRVHLAKELRHSQRERRHPVTSTTLRQKN